MYPDISYMVEALTGYRPEFLSFVKTFGFFLVLVFIVGGLIFKQEVIRKEKQGLIKGKLEKFVTGAPASVWDLLSNAFFGFVLGFKIPHIFENSDAFKVDGAAVLFSLEGNWPIGLLGAALLAGYKYWEMNRAKLATPIISEREVMLHERTWDLVIMAAVSGIVGSKVFAIAETMDQFLADPFGVFFSGSGMAIYGGLIGAFTFLFFYLRAKGVKVIHVMDAAAPTLIIGYAIGRLGCHMSGDGDWGIVSELANRPGWLAFFPDWFWAFDYPNNVIRECSSQLMDGTVVNPDCKWSETGRLVTPVFPTPLYEIIMGIVIFCILWAVRKRTEVAGVLFFLYLFFNGMERFFIEMIRVNDRYDWFFNLSQAQMIAVGFMLTGIGMMIYLTRRSKAGKPVIF